MKLSLIQELPTPHNNCLIRELKNLGFMDLKLYYVQADHPKYNSDKNNIYDAYIYGSNLNIFFIFKVFFDFKRIPVLVGWANINTMILHVLFYVSRRKFMHWSDLPVKFTNSGSLFSFRYLAYKVLLYSNSRILCVGNHTLAHFRNMGFPYERLSYFPIFVDVPKEINNKKKAQNFFSKKYDLDCSKVWIFAGSRLVPEKGLDILIDASTILRKEVSQNINVIIVGSGPLDHYLRNKVKQLKLDNFIRLIPWLDSSEFIKLLRTSDIVIQPSRNETYGIAAISLANGVPVIGSTTAGAALDKIKNGVNGYLFDVNDIYELSEKIELLVVKSDLRNQMSVIAHQMEKSHTPVNGAKLLVELCTEYLNA